MSEISKVEKFIQISVLGNFKTDMLTQRNILANENYEIPKTEWFVKMEWFS